MAALASRARDRKLGADEMKGGTFTVSNQGAFGGEQFTPVINKPEAAILGVGRTRKKPVAAPDGLVAVRPLVPLAVSYDHRLIDGGSAARFITDLVANIENFPEEEAVFRA
jgi:pyruvate dehydrogenase E2 component (dihydrolipoamide acetyltransferase)